MITNPVERELTVKEMVPTGQQIESDNGEWTDLLHPKEVNYKFTIGHVDEEIIGVTQVKTLHAENPDDIYEEVASFHMTVDAYKAFAEAVQTFEKNKGEAN
jgi:hypothetical protein